MGSANSVFLSNYFFHSREQQNNFPHCVARLAYTLSNTWTCIDIICVLHQSSSTMFGFCLNVTVVATVETRKNNSTSCCCYFCVWNTTVLWNMQMICYMMWLSHGDRCHACVFLVVSLDFHSPWCRGRELVRDIVWCCLPPLLYFE